MQYRAGEIIYLTMGEYSDYQVMGIFLVAKDFTIAEIKATPVSSKSWEMQMIEAGYIIELPARECSTEYD